MLFGNPVRMERSDETWMGLSSGIDTVHGDDARYGRGKKRTVQASMVVNGSITVSIKGHVKGYTLDHPEKLPSAVTGLLAKAVPHWRFRPVLRHGKAVAAKAEMHLRIVASPVGNKRYSLSVGGARFGNGGRLQASMQTRPSTVDVPPIPDPW